MKQNIALRLERSIIIMITLLIATLTSIVGFGADNCQCEPAGTPYQVWYLDSDGDGLGDAFNARIGCQQPFRYVANSLDNDDTIANKIISSSENEISEWYKDADGDGFGDALNVIISVARPQGYVADSTDQDDTNESIWFDDHALTLTEQNKD